MGLFYHSEERGVMCLFDGGAGMVRDGHVQQGDDSDRGDSGDRDRILDIICT